jgi:hypothetical protein
MSNQNNLEENTAHNKYLQILNKFDDIDSKFKTLEIKLKDSDVNVEIFNKEIKNIIFELKEKLNSNLKNPFESENLVEEKIYLKFPNKKILTTKEILLTKGKSSFFSGLLSNKTTIPIEYSVDGGIIINRDEKSFEIILDYLEFKTLPSPSTFENVNWKKVNSEINFYGFDIPEIKKHIGTILFTSYYSKDYIKCTGITINGKNSLMEIDSQNIHFWYSLFIENGWNVDHIISNKQPPKTDTTTFILSKFDIENANLDIIVDI